MDRNEYNHTIENTKRHYHSSLFLTAIILDIILIPFLLLPLAMLSFMLTQSALITAIVSIAVISAIIALTLFICMRINADTDKQVQNIYCKEIPIDCPSCAAHFSVIAGNAEKCPYCGNLVLVNNQGKIVQKD